MDTSTRGTFAVDPSPARRKWVSVLDDVRPEFQVDAVQDRTLRLLMIRPEFSQAHHISAGVSVLR